MINWIIEKTKKLIETYIENFKDIWDGIVGLFSLLFELIGLLITILWESTIVVVVFIANIFFLFWTIILYAMPFILIYHLIKKIKSN